MINLGRYIALVTLVLSGYWFGRTHDVEALICFIGALAAFLSSDIYWQVNKARRAGDKKVFRYLSSLLPYNQGIGYLKNYFDSMVAYRREDIQFLKEFWHLNQDPNNRFITPDLEMTRKELVRKVDAFLTLLNKSAFPMDGNPEWSKVYPSNVQAFKNINYQADEVVKWYGYFIHEGKKRGFNE